MVEHVPSAVELHDAAVVVPGIRVAAVVVDDHAAVCVGTEHSGCGRVADACGASAPGDVRKHEIIHAAAFRELDALVEIVAGLVDHARMEGAGFDTGKIGLEHGALCGELSPEIVHGAVVIAEHRRVDLLGPGVCESGLERAGRGVGRGDALSVRLVGHAVEDVPFPVVEHRVGRVERRVRGGHAVVGARRSQNAAPCRPGAKVARLEHVVEVRAVCAAGRAHVARAKHVQCAVGTSARGGVREELAFRGDRVCREG